MLQRRTSAAAPCTGIRSAIRSLPGKVPQICKERKPAGSKSFRVSQPWTSFGRMLLRDSIIFFGLQSGGLTLPIGYSDEIQANN
jgi:hypothetical protein